MPRGPRRVYRLDDRANVSLATVGGSRCSPARWAKPNVNCYNTNMSSGEPGESRDPRLTLALLCDEIEKLRECARGLPVERQTEILRGAIEARNKLDYAITSLTAAVDRVEVKRLDGHASCAGWLRDECNMTGNAAYGQVRLARRLPDLPGTAAAFASGRLSYQHASVISRTVERVVRYGGRAEDAELAMLEEAKHSDPYSLLIWGRRLRHQLCPDDLADEESEQRERRWLDIRKTWDGGYDIEGHLDAEGGTIVKTAIEAVLGPRDKSDPRAATQWRADGLEECGRRCLNSGNLPLRGGQRPHITITATLETLLGVPGADAAELDWGIPISGRMVRRIALDAELTPMLVNGQGSPLHVGRKYRTAPPKLRKALAERDRRCTWPGCDRPPEWCQGDHSLPWVEGGETDIDAMRLLCTKHHRMKTAGYRPERLPDGRVIPVRSAPPGPVFGPAVHSPPPVAAR
jgi:Domain of unknown function (DUF222)/HNH endonuclease